MRALWVIFGLMALCVGTIRGQEPAKPARHSDEYQAAYKQGRAEADRELKDQTATIYSYGLPESLFESLDRDTGLRWRQFGCVVNDTILGRVNGHNDRIMESIKAHGVPKNSFKPWEKELFGLEDYFKSRRKHEKAETLTADGPALKSPDGTCTIKLIAKSVTSDGKEVKRLSLELSGDGRKPRGSLVVRQCRRQDGTVLGAEGIGLGRRRRRRRTSTTSSRPWTCDERGGCGRSSPRAAEDRELASTIDRPRLNPRAVAS